MRQRAKKDTQKKRTGHAGGALVYSSLSISPVLSPSQCARTNASSPVFAALTSSHGKRPDEHSNRFVALAFSCTSGAFERAKQSPQCTKQRGTVFRENVAIPEEPKIPDKTRYFTDNSAGWH